MLMKITDVNGITDECYVSHVRISTSSYDKFKVRVNLDSIAPIYDGDWICLTINDKDELYGKVAFAYNKDNQYLLLMNEVSWSYTEKGYYNE